MKFEAVAEKTAKDSRGLLYFAAPCTKKVWIDFLNSVDGSGSCFDIVTGSDRDPVGYQFSTLPVLRYRKFFDTINTTTFKKKLNTFLFRKAFKLPPSTYGSLDYHSFITTVHYLFRAGLIL